MPNDYISREAALAVIGRAPGGHEYDKGVDYSYEAVQNLTAADVVEVVRCKDCEQYVAGEIGYGKCNFFKTAIFSEFYCRYGGKKGRSE